MAFLSSSYVVSSGHRVLMCALASSQTLGSDLARRLTHAQSARDRPQVFFSQGVRLAGRIVVLALLYLCCWKTSLSRDLIRSCHYIIPWLLLSILPFHFLLPHVKPQPHPSTTHTLRRVSTSTLVVSTYCTPPPNTQWQLVCTHVIVIRTSANRIQAAYSGSSPSSS